MTTTRRLLHLVPRLPPMVDGLGDYAVVIAQALTAQQIDSQFLVTDPSWLPTTANADRTRLEQHSTAALLKALNLGAHSTILLHYVNYAYAPHHGCPRWLINALTAWRKQSADHRLFTMFHELYATSSQPWQKVFWTSPLQRALTKRLAGVSDVVLTSNQRYAELLHAMPGTPQAEIWPVVSNIGEPAEVSAFDARPPALVVFGRAVNRQRAYQRHAQTLARFCTDHGITTLHDVGDGEAVTIPALTGVTLQRHGRLSSTALSALLNQVRFGMLDLTGGQLGKSGVFAAYASHGVIPVLDEAQPARDGLSVDVTYLALARPANQEQRLPIIADAVRAWYQRHNAATLAARLAQVMQSTGITGQC